MSNYLPNFLLHFHTNILRKTTQDYVTQSRGKNTVEQIKVGQPQQEMTKLSLKHKEDLTRWSRGERRFRRSKMYAKVVRHKRNCE